MLQPLDLGIHCMKAKSRKALVQKTIAVLERKAELKINVLQAPHIVMAEWKLVDSDTRAHCFSKGKFGITSHNMDVEEDLIDEEYWYIVL
jgi:hypothetical protein